MGAKLQHLHRSSSRPRARRGISETARLRRRHGGEWLPEALKEFSPDAVVLYSTAMGDETDLVHLGRDADWFHERFHHAADFGRPKPWISVYLSPAEAHAPKR